MAEQVKLDVDRLKTDLNNIKTMYTDFSDLLTGVNEYMDENLNASVESAIYGEFGAKLKEEWDENSDVFKNFSTSYDKVIDALTAVVSSKENFVADTEALYKTDNSSSSSGTSSTSATYSSLKTIGKGVASSVIDGVTMAAKNISSSSSSSDASSSTGKVDSIVANLKKASNKVSENIKTIFSDIGSSVSTIKNGDTTTTTYTHKDGSKKVVTTTKNGDVETVITQEYDANGNVTSESKTSSMNTKEESLSDISSSASTVKNDSTTTTTYTNQDGSKKVVTTTKNGDAEKVTTQEYDANGKIIRENTTSSTITTDSSGRHETILGEPPVLDDSSSSDSSNLFSDIKDFYDKDISSGTANITTDSSTTSSGSYLKNASLDFQDAVNEAQKKAVELTKQAFGNGTSVNSDTASVQQQTQSYFDKVVDNSFNAVSSGIDHVKQQANAFLKQSTTDNDYLKNIMTQNEREASDLLKTTGSGLEKEAVDLLQKNSTTDNDYLRNLMTQNEREVSDLLKQTMGNGTNTTSSSSNKTRSWFSWFK